MENADIEQEARDAAPRTASEESEMLQAERTGRNRARGDSIESPGEENPEDFEK